MNRGLDDGIPPQPRRIKSTPMPTPKRPCDKKPSGSMGLSLGALVRVAVLPLVAFASGVAWVLVDQKKSAVSAELAGIARALQVAIDRQLD